MKRAKHGWKQMPGYAESLDHTIQLDKHVLVIWMTRDDRWSAVSRGEEGVPDSRWRETIKLVLDNFKR